MNIKRLLVSILIAGTQAAATASDFTPTHVGLHLGSVHDRAGFNNLNLGLAFRWAEKSGMLGADTGAFVAGVYCNSLNTPSVYAGYELEWEVAQNWSASIAAGLVTGYPKIGSLSKGKATGNAGCAHRTAEEKARPQEVALPFVLPGIAYKMTEKQSVRLHYLPKMQPKGVHVLHLIVMQSF